MAIVTVRKKCKGGGLNVNLSGMSVFCIVGTNGIYVFGKRVKGKIIVNGAILGHELTRQLNFANVGVVNPDKLKNYLNSIRTLNSGTFMALFLAHEPSGNT